MMLGASRFKRFSPSAPADVAEIVFNGLRSPRKYFLTNRIMRRFFDKSIPRNPKDIVLVSNLFKAIKRGLKNYLEIPVQANSNAPIIFQKQIVRMHVFYLALLHFYQND